MRIWPGAVDERVRVGPASGGHSTGRDRNDELAVRSICHDVGTPAAAIKLLAELAGGEHGVPPTIQRSLREISGEAEVIMQICGDPLAKTRDQRTKVHEIAVEVARRARLVHRCAVTTKLESVKVPLQAVAVRRLLSNLIDNACRAAGVGGKVSILVRSADTVVVIEVSDSGPGPGAWSEHLETSPDGEVTSGLGLRIVRSITEISGGDMKVEQAAELSGSNVVVTLPGSPSHSEAGATLIVSEIALKGIAGRP